MTTLTTLLGRKAAKLSINVYHSYKSKENRDRQNRLILDQRLLPFDQPAIFFTTGYININRKPSARPTAGKMSTLGKIVTVLLKIVFHRMNYN